MKFENFNSPEKEILIEYFKKLPMMDKWIADIIQTYIYRIIEDETPFSSLLRRWP